LSDAAASATGAGSDASARDVSESLCAVTEDREMSSSANQRGEAAEFAGVEQRQMSPQIGQDMNCELPRART
jgi:hypothetical protein